MSANNNTLPPIPLEIQQIVFSEDGFIQLAAALGTILLAYVAKGLLGKAAERTVKSKQPGIKGQLLQYFVPVMAPVFTLLFTAVAYFTIEYLGHDIQILKIFVQVVLLWFVLTALQSFTESSLAKLSGALFIIPIIGLSVSGLLDPLIKFLKEISFKAGDFKVSAYNAISSIIALVVLIWIAGLISRGVESYIRKFRRLRSSDRDLITKGFNVILYIAVFLIALNVMGVDLTALAVLGGAVGVGIGFGLQKITSNFISGIILLFEKSVEPDDVVELADGTVGVIRKTFARYTLIEMPDGKELFIPNEDFIINRVSNWTHGNSRGRIDINVGVSYDSDLELAQKLMLEAAQEHSRTIEEPGPTCVMRQFGDSSVQFQLMFWVSDVRDGRFAPQSDVMFSIWRKFKEHGVKMPFPQRDLNITHLPEIVFAGGGKAGGKDAK